MMDPPRGWRSSPWWVDIRSRENAMKQIPTKLTVCLLASACNRVTEDAPSDGILRGILKADHVGLFHLPIRLFDDAPQALGQFAAGYPDMFLLRAPGGSITFAP